MTTLINLNYHAEGRAAKHSGNRTAGRREFSNIPEEHLKGYGTVLKKYS
jgi:hypothetical protein